jgi:hypothetical protein
VAFPGWFGDSYFAVEGRRSPRLAVSAGPGPIRFRRWTCWSSRAGLPVERGRVTPRLGPVNLPGPSEVAFAGRSGDSYFPWRAGRRSPPTRWRSPRPRVRLDYRSNLGGLHLGWGRLTSPDPAGWPSLVGLGTRTSPWRAVGVPKPRLAGPRERGSDSIPAVDLLVESGGVTGHNVGGLHPGWGRLTSPDPARFPSVWGLVLPPERRTQTRWRVSASPGPTVSYEGDRSRDGACGNLGPMKADTPGNKGPMKGRLSRGVGWFRPTGGRCPAGCRDGGGSGEVPADDLR